jgi:beta-lactamase class A
MPRYELHQKQKFRKRYFVGFLGVCFFALLVAGYFVYSTQNNQLNDRDSVNYGAEKIQQPIEEPPFAFPSVQQELDVWLESARGEYGVVLQDPVNGSILATHQQDKQFFSASIYKLYVAYLGLQDIESGIYEADEVYVGNSTRLECIVLMVRDSDSPCAETMWVEQGKDRATQRLREFGLQYTDMNTLQTAASDANILMMRLQQEKDLNKVHTELLRTALREQIYRDAIVAALPSAAVYNKVGFYETGWHDTAIIQLASGKELVLTIFNKDAGSRQTKALTETLFNPLIGL